MMTRTASHLRLVPRSEPKPVAPIAFPFSTFMTLACAGWVAAFAVATWAYFGAPRP